MRWVITAVMAWAVVGVPCAAWTQDTKSPHDSMTQDASSDEKKVSEVSEAVRKKSAAEVKKYFGRKPDEANSTYEWIYTGQFFDEDSEHTMTKCVIRFGHDGLANSVYFEK